MSYKSLHGFLERRDESVKIIKKYPDRLPVICERKFGSYNISNIDRTKYLVPKTLSFGQFIFMIRKKLKLSPNHALFFFINGQIPATAESMLAIYEKYAESDGFIYITYTNESVFG